MCADLATSPTWSSVGRVNPVSKMVSQDKVNGASLNSESVSTNRVTQQH